MVVGPRYIPAIRPASTGGGWAPDTDRVPDASRITPPVAEPGTRAGHDISIEVDLDAGVPLDAIARRCTRSRLSERTAKRRPAVAL